MSLGDQLPGAVMADLVEMAVADELDEAGQVRQEERLVTADRHPFSGQGVAADLPAAVDLAEHHLVRHEDVVDEHGVEQRVAGQLAQRLDLDPFALHVQQEVGDAVVLGGVGIGAGQQRTPLGELRGGGPDLLAGDPPPAVDLGGLRGQAGQIRTRTRLGEQLAPDHLAAERRRQESLLLCLGAVGDDRRDQPCGDAHIGSLDPSGGEFLRDDDLLDGGRGPAPRFGQVRLDPAALGDRGVALFPRDLLECGDFGADVVAQLLGLGVEVDLDGPHTACDRGVEHPLRGLAAAAEGRDQAQGPPVVDVGGVLPGEADAPVHLDAVLSALLGGGRRQCGGHRGGELVMGGFVVPVLRGRLVEGTGGVPHRGGGAFGGRDHLGAAVLDGLELADRPAELLADLGVLRRGVGRPPGDADRLGGQQRGGDGASRRL